MQSKAVEALPGNGDDRTSQREGESLGRKIEEITYRKTDAAYDEEEQYNLKLLQGSFDCLLISRFERGSGLFTRPRDA